MQTIDLPLLKVQPTYEQRRSRITWRPTPTYMHTHVEGPPLADWDSIRALELWYIEKTRRPNVKHTHQLQGGLKAMR